MKESESSKVQLLIGYASAIGTLATYDASASCVQALQGAIPDFQLSLIRSVVQVALYMIGGKLAGAQFSIDKETIPRLLYLAAAYTAVNIGFFGASTYLPLTDVVGIANIAMMITAFLHSRVLFNNEITKGNIISSAVCIVGIILTVQPSWLFKHMIYSDCNMTSSSFENVSKALQLLDSSACSEDYISKGAMSIGYVLSMIGGVGSGLTYDISGIMLKDVKPVVQAAYGAGFCTIGSVAFMFYLEQPVWKMNLRQFMLASGHAVSSAISSFLHIQAAKYIPGPSLSVLYSFDLVTLLIWQYTIMHSLMPGNYNWIEVVGCMIIVFGASIPATLDILMHRAKADELP